VLNPAVAADTASMDDESGIVESGLHSRPSVTNVNIFALAPVAGGQATPARAEIEPAESRETLVSPEWLERRNGKLDVQEQELRRRAAELDLREAELEQREAEFEAEIFIRSEALEEREQRLEELDQRLERREDELGSYVARLQGGFLHASGL
jgi:DNA repair exonuclease SbcCD ATPase subunit